MKTGQAKPLQPMVVLSSELQSYPVTKSELAFHWDVARNTIRHYDAIACETLPEYRKTYPTKKGSVATPDTTYPLQPFQTWVLNRIRYMLRQSRDANYVKNFIKQNRQAFAREKFQAEINQHKGQAA